MLELAQYFTEKDGLNTGALSKEGRWKDSRLK